VLWNSQGKRESPGDRDAGVWERGPGGALADVGLIGLDSGTRGRILVGCSSSTASYPLAWEESLRLLWALESRCRRREPERVQLQLLQVPEQGGRKTLQFAQGSSVVSTNWPRRLSWTNSCWFVFARWNFCPEIVSFLPKVYNISWIFFPV